MRVLLFFFLLLLTIPCFSQKKIKLKPFVEFQSKRTFGDYKTKYFGVNLGIRAKCKFKVGVAYAWLSGSFESQTFPVDTLQFSGATALTQTKGQFFSLLLSPLVAKNKRYNIALPIHLGIMQLDSEYENLENTFISYHQSNPFFFEISGDIDFKLSPILKFGLSIGYRNVFTDLDIGKEVFTTPIYGIKLKLGRLCKS